MNFAPREPRPSVQRRALPNRRSGLDRRIGERRLELVPSAVEQRRAAERRHLANRRRNPGRRRTDREGGHPLLMLFVGDHAANARLVRDLLDASWGERFELETVGRPAAAIERLTGGGIDVVLLDLSSPHSRGLETFAQLAAAAPDVPVLVLSHRDDEQLALEAVRAGAQDYLVKGQFEGELLSRALRYAIERQRLRTALWEGLLLDDLTGLYNRRGFLTLANHDLRLARRADRLLLVALADLDDLKRINDTWGHAEGDRALKDTAGILRHTFRESDLIARIGGDEFAVLMRDAATESAAVLATRLNRRVQDFNRRAARRYRVSLSLGFAPHKAGGVASVEALLQRADEALYQEKHRKHGGPARG